MKKYARTEVIGTILAVIGLAIVMAVESFLRPSYLPKTLVKIACFAVPVLIYAYITKKDIRELIFLHPLKKNIRPLLYSVLLCFLGIFLLFLIFHKQIDLSSLRTSLMSKEGLTKQNCLFVFTYIILFNSFLEESFFRGFLAHSLPNRKASMILSALLFAVYHIGIVSTWFNPFVFLICIGGLFLVALFLQGLAEHFGSILGSYIAHASANIAINVIGALLIFEIL